MCRWGFADAKAKAPAEELPARPDCVDEVPDQARQHAKSALRYVLAALGCVAFTLIYYQFSHGVYSPFMTFMFALPLVGGALPAIALHFAKARPVPVRARQAWALALATLTVASCLRGIFVIAGTSSIYLVVYPVTAAVFAIAACVLLIRDRRRLP